MIDYFFDTDCLSSFAWVDAIDIVFKVISQTIVIPNHVVNELKKVPHLFVKLEPYIFSKKVITMEIEYGTKEEELFNQFTTKPLNNKTIIGDGEASCLALAITHNGVVASNNLKDIKMYCEYYHLQFITTAEILNKAYNQGIITITIANDLWLKMLQKRRKLPASSFSDYLNILK